MPHRCCQPLSVERAAIVLVAVVAVMTLALPAHGDDRTDYTKHDWPVQVILRPLTLAPEMTEIAGDTFFISVSKDRILDPIALAPDIYTAITRRFSLGFTHELGLCLNKTGCSATYNDVALNGIASIVHHGQVQLATRVGLAVPQFDEFQLGLVVGAKVRLRTGRIALILDPQIYVGVFGRATTGQSADVADGRDEYIDARCELQLQLTTRALLFVTSGLRGPTASFGESYLVPLGFGGLFALNHRVDLGAELRFENALGGEATLPAGADIRSLLLRAALRL